MALTYSELQAVSTKYYDPNIGQQVYDAVPFLKYLKANKRIKVKGGNSLTFPIRYRRLDQTDAVGWEDSATFMAKNTRTTAELDWAPYRGETMFTWEQDVKNSAGKTRIVDLAEDKSGELKEDLAYRLATDIWATSSVSGHLIPLSTIVDEGDTYAGVATSDASAWAGYEDTSSTKMTRALLHDSVAEASWGDDMGPKGKEGRHYTTRALLADYATLLSGDERYVNTSEMNSGATTLTLMGKPVIEDPFVPSGDWYGLDMSQFEFWVHPANNMKVSEWFELLPSYPGSYGKYVTCVCNLICRTRRVNFKLTALTGT